MTVAFARAGATERPSVIGSGHAIRATRRTRRVDGVRPLAAHRNQQGELDDRGTGGWSRDATDGWWRDQEARWWRSLCPQLKKAEGVGAIALFGKKTVCDVGRSPVGFRRWRLVRRSPIGVSPVQSPMIEVLRLCFRADPSTEQWNRPTTASPASRSTASIMIASSHVSERKGAR